MLFKCDFGIGMDRMADLQESRRDLVDVIANARFEFIR